METVSKTLPLLFILAWIFPVAMLCKNIVHEKEKRLKEMMKIMGLGNGVHWVAWFISAFLVMFVTIVCIVLMVKVSVTSVQIFTFYLQSSNMTLPV